MHSDPYGSNPVMGSWMPTADEASLRCLGDMPTQDGNTNENMASMLSDLYTIKQCLNNPGNGHTSSAKTQMKCLIKRK